MESQGTAVGDEMLNTIKDTRGHTDTQKYLINWLTKNEGHLNCLAKPPFFKIQAIDVKIVNNEDIAKIIFTQHQIQSFLEQLKDVLGSINAKIT